MVFSPLDHQNYSTVVYLRNNLTMLEPILLQGAGGSAVAAEAQGRRLQAAAQLALWVR